MAQASSALSSTGISMSIPRRRSGAIEAVHSVTLAPRDVPPTTACSISRWSSSATVCWANWSIEYWRMSSGRSERPWPSRSSVITRLPRSASSRASGTCIRWENRSPGSSTQIRGPSPYTM